MSILQAIILGIVQGLTEFLPISSSAHLIIVPWLFNWHYLLNHPDFNKTFDVALHLGTLIALAGRTSGATSCIFWRVGAHHREAQRGRPEGKLAWLILVSTIPAGVVGRHRRGLLHARAGQALDDRRPAVRLRARDVRMDRAAKLDRQMEQLTWSDALLIGLAQALALAPGVSRSGVTMVTGLALRLDRESAARYSFLMSIPVVGGAAAFKGVQVASTGLPAGTAARLPGRHRGRRAQRLRRHLVPAGVPAHPRLHHLRHLPHRRCRGHGAHRDRCGLRAATGLL